MYLELYKLYLQYIKDNFFLVHFTLKQVELRSLVFSYSRISIDAVSSLSSWKASSKKRLPPPSGRRTSSWGCRPD